MALNSQLAGEVLRYVQVSSALGKRALDEVGQHRQAKKTASAAVPALVQQMLDAGVIQPAQKTAAETMLGDHAQSLTLLHNSIEKLAAAKKEIATLKQAGDGDRLGRAEKTASDNGDPGHRHDRPVSVILGARTSEKKASDIALFTRLGLTQFTQQ